MNIYDILLTDFIDIPIGNRQKCIEYSKEYALRDCPFCDHKWHFSVSKDFKKFRSYNECCKPGNIISFISQYRGLSLRDTYKWIKENYKIDYKRKFISRSDKNKIKTTNLAIREFEDELIFKFFKYVNETNLDYKFSKAFNIEDRNDLVQYILTERAKIQGVKKCLVK